MAVLAKAFGQLNAEVATPAPCPTLHGSEVIGYPMLFGHPTILACVSRQHGLLLREYRADIRSELRCNPATLPVSPADRVHEIEMGDCIQRARRSGQVVGYGGGETGVSRQQADGLMVGVIVGGRRGNHNLGLSPPDQFGDRPTTGVVVEDRQITQPSTPILRPDHCRGCSRLGLTNPGGFLRTKLLRSAFTRRGGCYDHAVSCPGHEGQRTCAEGLGIVGVGM